MNLASYTTLQIGGPATRFVAPTTPDALVDAVRQADAAGERVLILGGGSNLVVADTGFDGVVIQPKTQGMRSEHLDGSVLLTVEAGEAFDDVVAYTVGKGWAGIECLSGIPGAMGAAPIQNIGAYGQEVGAVITQVEVYDRQHGRVEQIHNATCGFGYRTSHFKRTPDRYVVCSVTLRLVPGGPATLAYAALARSLGDAPDLEMVRAEVLRLRRSKSMVWDSADLNHRSAGSFFMNPVLDEDAAQVATTRAAGLALPAPPSWPMADGRRKWSAAWLIDHAGMPKGYGSGRVGLSSRHTLALVNRGGATAAELVAFAAHVRARVFNTFGVTLHPEPVFVGFAQADGDGVLDAVGWPRD